MVKDICKMRKTFFCVAAAMTLSVAHAQDSYKITGTVDDSVVTGDTVFLCQMQGLFSMVPEDTAIVTADNKFEFTGSYDGAALRFILPMHKGSAVAMPDFILENADISMQVVKSPGKTVVTGGPAAKLYEEFNNGCAVYDKMMEKSWSIVRDSTVSDELKKPAQAEVDSISALRNAYAKKFIIDNIPSAVSDMLLSYYENLFTGSEYEEALRKMGEGHHYVFYKNVMAERAASKATAVGEQYTDLVMPGPDGNTVKVSDYVSKNRYTLIDFWASWCGPCRAEMPNVVKAYDLYHAKGFEVVGVSFDNNKDAWIKAIGTLNLPWPHMSDLKGWGCAAAPIYNVKGIPANVLVDRNGKIVAKNLREEALLDTLSKLMK